MKTKANLIIIFMISSFLVSLTAISISLAKSQQDERLPDSQQPPPRTGVPRAVPPKSEFWDLEVDEVIINGQSFSYPLPSGPAPVIQVKVGDPVHCTCHYKMKTIPISEITGSDAKHWGSGNLSYMICAQIYEYPNFYSSVKVHCSNRKLPKFTYEDVKNWPLVSRKSLKTWTSHLDYNWTATAEYIGGYKKLFVFWVDEDDTIKETDEDNNGLGLHYCRVAEIVVIP